MTDEIDIYRAAKVTCAYYDESILIVAENH